MGLTTADWIIVAVYVFAGIGFVVREYVFSVADFLVAGRWSLKQV